MKKALFWGAMLALLAVGVFLLIWGSAGFQLQREVKAAEEAAVAGGVYDLAGAEALLADMETEEVQERLEKLAAHLQDGCPLPAAELAVRMLPAEAAADLTAEILAGYPVSSDWDKHHLQQLPELLAGLSPAQLTAVLSGAQIASGDAALQDQLGQIAAGRLTLEQAAEVCRTRLAARQPNDRLIGPALGAYGQEEILSALAAQTDAELRAVLAQAYGRTLTDPDAVLAYLAGARAAGIPATECYPNGAAVTWDLSGLKRDGWAWGIHGVSPRYLLVRVTESEEKFEYRNVPLDVDMDTWEYEGGFEDGYESNSGPFTQTRVVHIDTAAMDATPAELLPASLEELGALLVLETSYESLGVLRVQSTQVKSATGGRSVYSYKDYMQYVAVQRVDVYDQKGLHVHRFALQVTEPEELEVNKDGYSRDLTTNQIRRACLPVPDAAWMDAQYAEITELLAGNGGDLWAAVENAKK